MKINTVLSLAAMSTLLAATSCRNDSDDQPAVPRGAYENGIIVANEGNYGRPNAEVSFLDTNLNTITNGIYGASNSSESLGDVLNSVAFNGDNAFLVANNSNKIIKVNRYTFKKVSEITQNIVMPRYMTFSNGKSYVTNNNFGFGKPITYKLTVYDAADKFIKEISFDRYAEKIAAQSGFVYVQTDGVKYDSSYQPQPTGHTITRVSAATDTVDKTITLSDPGMIQDMASANGAVYVLSTGASDSYVYKIDAATGTVAQPVTLKSVKLGHMSIDRDSKVYFEGGGAVYGMTATAINKLFTTSVASPYAFNVIDGKVYISDAKDFTANSVVTVYSAAGAVLKTYTAGMGVNGFYKN